MSRERPWVPHDSYFLSVGDMRYLGYEFGACGPLTFLAVRDLAKQQDNGGVVRARYDEIAELAFVEDAGQGRLHRAREIVYTIESLGKVDGDPLLSFVATDGAHGFVAVLEQWDLWNELPEKDRERKRRERALKALHSDSRPARVRLVSGENPPISREIPAAVPSVSGSGPGSVPSASVVPVPGTTIKDQDQACSEVIPPTEEALNRRNRSELSTVAAVASEASSV